MNWDAIGAVGELIGAVAVVITLLYVARQIHQANTQTQARARYSFIDAYGEMNSSISNNRELASRAWRQSILGRRWSGRRPRGFQGCGGRGTGKR